MEIELGLGSTIISEEGGWGSESMGGKQEGISGIYMIFGRESGTANQVTALLLATGLPSWTWSLLGCWSLSKVALMG